MADKKPQRFTFDPESDGAEVPTLTSLLYKKNVVKTKGSANKGALGFSSTVEQEDRSRIMTLEPTTTIERPRPSAVEEALPIARTKTQTGVSMPGVGLAPELIRSSFAAPTQAAPSMGAITGDPRHHRVVPAATAYSAGSLLPSVAPEVYPNEATGGHGIRMLYAKVAVAGAIVFEPTSSDTFTVKQIVAKNTKRNSVWSGMQVSTRDFGDLWGRLQKYGFAEFSTLGVAGQGNFDRTAFRVAFQLENTEWVTLIRTRQPTGDEAIVAVITQASVQALLPSFHSSTLPKTSAA